MIPFGSVLFPNNSSRAEYPDFSIFYDDFSINTSGWDRLQTEEGITDYLDGEYHIIVNETNSDYFSTLYRDYKNIGLLVEAYRVEGPEDNNYGLICRYQDEKNFYAGMISSDGYFGIFQVKDGTYNLLGFDEMQYSERILLQNQKNILAFDCHQEYLILSINGEVVDFQKDDAYTSGDVGLIAGTFDNTGVHIAFDNLHLIDTEKSIGDLE